MAAPERLFRSADQGPPLPAGRSAALNLNRSGSFTYDSGVEGTCGPRGLRLETLAYGDDEVGSLRQGPPVAAVGVIMPFRGDITSGPLDHVEQSRLLQNNIVSTAGTAVDMWPY